MERAGFAIYGLVEPPSGTSPMRRKRLIRHEDVMEADARMIGRHIESPQIFLAPHTGHAGRNEKACDAFGVAVIARRARKGNAMRGDMHARRPHLLAVDSPAGHAVPRLARSARFHMRRIGTVIRVRQPESETRRSGGGSRRMCSESAKTARRWWWTSGRVHDGIAGRREGAL
jgi:hypothetical protein